MRVTLEVVCALGQMDQYVHGLPRHLEKVARTLWIPCAARVRIRQKMNVVDANLEVESHHVAGFHVHLRGREVVACAIGREVDADDLATGVGSERTADSSAGDTRARPAGRRRGGLFGRLGLAAASGEARQRDCGDQEARCLR